MKVLYAASEAVPFCKTGGLADVAGSLPPALAAQGVETAVILPLYRRVKERFADQLTFVLRLCRSCVAARLLRPVLLEKGRCHVVFSG